MKKFEKGRESGNGSGQEQPEGWRTVLLEYAGRIREATLAGRQPPELTPETDPDNHTRLVFDLGPMSAEALRIVEDYAVGSTMREPASGREEEEAPPEFFARLNIVLNGVAPTQTTTSRRDAPSPQVIQSELWQLLYKVRESAELAYAREIDLVELDRRILFLLKEQGPLVPADIASTTGVDKAQVSRSVKRLLDDKMLERSQIRSPLQLTRKGSAVSARLARLAGMRNRELTFDIKDDELEEFFAAIEVLLERSVSLYEREHAINHGQEQAGPGNFPIKVAFDAHKRPEKIIFNRTRIISPLMTLSAYFSRSGSLTFKRLTGLSNFEVWVLNEIANDPPMEWNTLVARLDRDHSQAGRTVQALLDRELIIREGRPGRRHGRFSPSEEGQRLYEIIQDASRQRSTFLMAPLSQGQRDRFLATFDKVHRNAVVQLERERTFEELGHTD